MPAATNSFNGPHCWMTQIEPVPDDLDLDSTPIQVGALGHTWRHSNLFWAATSASSQVIHILNKSLLTVLLQFVRWRPGPLLNPGTSQCNACRGMRWWSIRVTCPSHRSLLSLNMSSVLHCPVLTLTSSFVTLSFQAMPKMLLCHLWWAAFSLSISVAVRGHTSALYRRVWENYCFNITSSYAEEINQLHYCLIQGGPN